MVAATTQTETKGPDPILAAKADRVLGPIPEWANLLVADEVAAEGIPLSLVVPEVGFAQPESGVSRTLAVLRWVWHDILPYGSPTPDDVAQLRYLVGDGETGT